jgi:hypothetical protein
MAPHRLHLYRTEGRDLRRYLTGRDESFQMFSLPVQTTFRLPGGAARVRLLVLLARFDRAKDAEILILRYRVAVADWSAWVTSPRPRPYGRS